MADRLQEPVFFIGFPRSGTTIVFERFVRSPEFGWLSNYSEMRPCVISMNMLCRILDNKLIRLRGHKKQYGKVLLGNRYLPQPVEAYAFWDYYTGVNFSRDYLLGRVASNSVRERVRHAVQSSMLYQGKYRFATKLTGPGRINYLLSIFPDSKFVHVVRDGRAVTESLLRVEFWRDKGGFIAPFWEHGLRSESINDWEQSGKDPLVLAAHQWRRVIETMYEEASTLGDEQYIEVKYEDFVKSPREVNCELLLWAGVDCNVDELNKSRSSDQYIDMSLKYQDVFSKDQLANMNRIMGPMLDQLGYSV